MADKPIANKPMVLAVDDTPANLDLLNSILRDDYRVKVATNGAKALELANKDPQPNIILLDIMMPGMSGYEVCRLLKEQESTESIPVIFITARTEIEDEQKGLQLGAVDYVTKPFHQDIVLARVKTHLASHQRAMNLLKENRELLSKKGRAFSDFTEDSLHKLMESGEGQQLEFKSTLRWNLHTDRTDKSIENSCLKTVAGYLNSQGGILLIGVDDDGQAQGLERDGFKSEDRLILHWVNLVKSYLGAEFMHFIRTTAHSVIKQRILAVECLPGNKPIFFNRDNEEIFYVRMTNTTQALKTREVIAYIEQRFLEKPESQSAVSPEGREAIGSPVGGSEARNRYPDQSPHGHHSISQWFHELQQRRVIRTAVIYVVVAWGFTEISTTIAETLGAPDWLPRAFVLAFVGGFPVAMLMSWLYDLRVTRTDESTTDSPRRLLLKIAAAGLLSVATVGLYVLIGR